MTRITFCLTIILTGLHGIEARAQESARESLSEAHQFSEAFAAVAAKVKPAVAAIITERTVDLAFDNPFRGTPFGDYYFRVPRGPRSRQYQEGLSSGVIVRYLSDNYILTNNHAIRGAEKIQVGMADERYFEAEIVGTDSLSDLAVLKIDSKDLPHLTLGDSDSLKVGEWVLALGTPFGLEHTVTSGIVSALGRDRSSAREYGSFIQTDAAINPGNSGGALVNLHGELVGINTAIVSRTGGYQGIGFAIPANLARNVMEQLVEHGEVKRGLLGVTIDDIDPVTAEALDLENAKGVQITGVTPGRAADKAGVKRGDVVVKLEGESIRNTTDLRSRIGATPPGTQVELGVLRDGEEKTIIVVLEQLTEEVLAVHSSRPHGTEKLGMRVQTLTPELSRQLGYEEMSGVVVTDVLRGGEAARRGLRPMDLVQEVNRRPVKTVSDFYEAIGKLEGEEAVLLLVRRGNMTRFIGLKLPG